MMMSITTTTKKKSSFVPVIQIFIELLNFNRFSTLNSQRLSHRLEVFATLRNVCQTFIITG